MDYKNKNAWRTIEMACIREPGFIASLFHREHPLIRLSMDAIFSYSNKMKHKSPVHERSRGSPECGP